LSAPPIGVETDARSLASRPHAWLAHARRHPGLALGAMLLSAIALVALLAPWLGTVDPAAIAPARRMRPPSAEAWFGTDALGRDLWSRAVYGTRVSLAVGLSVALLATIGGLAIGLLAGFVRRADMVVMRVMDGIMSISSILLAISLIALTRGSVGNVILAVTVAEIPRVARLVRSVVLSLREQQLLSIARVVLTRPSFVFLDHPGRTLDAERIDRALSALCACRTTCVTVAGAEEETEHPGHYDALLEIGEIGRWSWTPIREGRIVEQEAPRAS